ncbi:hypothetical protein [Bradyrhizobium iriomotense]|uniref:hypothetical protein n=1 Tax=Bradyrhizobium iriomotense TaxID=441950 RepID=UPI001B8A6C5B|nr:hypothetical protein [Bradyrhizobium iriomotense]MBR1134025.1 hypothetical protein [Bradyrhizobium iriomotense]
MKTIRRADGSAIRHPMKLLARIDDENVIRHRSGKILQSAAAACSQHSTSERDR